MVKGNSEMPRRVALDKLRHPQISFDYAEGKVMKQPMFRMHHTTGNRREPSFTLCTALDYYLNTRGQGPSS